MLEDFSQALLGGFFNKATQTILSEKFQHTCFH